jgi:hypothetical protein
MSPLGKVFRPALGMDAAAVSDNEEDHDLIVQFLVFFFWTVLVVSFGHRESNNNTFLALFIVAPVGSNSCRFILPA